MKTFRFLYVLSCLVVLSSCHDGLKIDEQDSSQNEVVSFNMYHEGEMVLGERLTNPYSLKIMQKAADSLLATKGLPKEELIPTDYYVRFQPKDSLEYATLFNSDLELFDHPLDYEIEINGDYYHDPSIPENEITWQYTVVSRSEVSKIVELNPISPSRFDQYVDIDLTIIKKKSLRAQLIEECYIPENDLLTKSGKKLPISPEELEAAAISMANLPENYRPQPDTKGLFSKGYNPTGKMQFEEYGTYSSGSVVPLKGVRVRARYFLKWASAYTNDDGSYTIGTKFSCDPHMSIVFENKKDFVVWGNWAFLSPATHNMGRQDRTKPFNYTVKHNVDAWKWAAINNSGYAYYEHCSAKGINTPPSNLKIWCVKANWSSAPMLKHLKGYKLASGAVAVSLFLSSCPILGGIATGITALLSVALPDIFIGVDSIDYYYVRGSVFHELGHASHYSVVGESVWGPYIEHIVTSWISGKDCYGDGKKNDAKQKICELGEAWGYTSEYLEVGSSGGESNWFAPAYKSVRDVINKGYVTKTEAFSCLTKTTKNIDSFYNNLVTKFPNKIYEISKVFAENEALTQQTHFAIKNGTSKVVRIRFIKNGHIENRDVNPGDTYTIGHMPKKCVTPAEYTDSKHFANEMFIYVIDSGVLKEVFHSLGTVIKKDFFVKPFKNAWPYTVTTNPVGDKTVTTNTYEIKDSYYSL
ncbi:MAG: hypothetical protein IKT11_00760 [Bacteroidales bacterium]|nr:hypothetical protein [Bacteroidales bacterium]